MHQRLGRRIERMTMEVRNAAETDVALAAALGQLAQAAAQLEEAVADSIGRLLPLSTPMLDALLLGNSHSRNLAIFERLAALADIPLQAEKRDELKELARAVQANSVDRNRLVHGVIAPGYDDAEGSSGYFLIDGRGRTSAWPVHVDLILGFAKEARELAWQLLMKTPRPQHFPDEWVKDWRHVDEKGYPQRQQRRQPKPPRKG